MWMESGELGGLHSVAHLYGTYIHGKKIAIKKPANPPLHLNDKYIAYIANMDQQMATIVPKALLFCVSSFSSLWSKLLIFPQRDIFMYIYSVAVYRHYTIYEYL